MLLGMECVIEYKILGAKVAEFFSVLIFLFVAYLWGSVSYYTRVNQDRDKLLKRPSVKTTKIQTPPKPMMVVKRSVNDILGTYNNEKIYRYVELDDGRNFVFESVAVEKQPGVYHADSNDTYIIVDKYLLYRQVKIG